MFINGHSGHKMAIRSWTILGVVFRYQVKKNELEIPLLALKPKLLFGFELIKPHLRIENFVVPPGLELRREVELLDQSRFFSSVPHQVTNTFFNSPWGKSKFCSTPDTHQAGFRLTPG